MKKIFLSVFAFLLILPAFASTAHSKKIKNNSYRIDVDIKRFWGQNKEKKETHFKQTMTVENGKNVEFVFPDKSHSVELFISEELPDGLQAKNTKDLLYYDMKIYEIKEGQKKLMSSPEVVAYLGHEAKLSSVDEKQVGFEISFNSTKQK